MRLTRVEIQDYRSVFAGESTAPLTFDLADGMNTLVGTNNCGKSNILRAIALALDPHYEFDPVIDTPGPRRFAHPIVTLVFRAQGDREVDQELMAAVRAYEQSFGSGSYYSDEGEVHLRVAYEPTDADAIRRELILLPGGEVPSMLVEEQMVEDILARLREAVRFVLISSGESIRSVLDGNFREILHSVVKERLSEAFSDAESSRASYVSGIEESLLAPLRDRLVEDIGGLFPEIAGATLAPEVPTIERTLSRVNVALEDLVDTPLSEKGTGVRGGVLVAMLSYLANNATRGMIFALEEPEAFLHPAAQEDLRDHLEEIACRDDVSLLVTTHSPHIVTRSADGRVFGVAKDRAGRTRVAETIRGDEDPGPIVSALHRPSTYEEILKKAQDVPADTKAVVFVEGDGDKFSLEFAAKVVGRPDLLEGVDIRPAGNASKTVLPAIVTRAAIAPRPVLVLLDNDEAGLVAYKNLVSGTIGFKKKKEALTYAAVFPENCQSFPIEAEDLFDDSLWEAFVEEHGKDIIKEMAKRPDGGRHYGFDQAVKEVMTPYLETNTGPQHVRRWIELILHLRELAGLEDMGATVDEIIEGAPPSVEEPPEFEGLAFVVADRLAYARYQSQGALLLDTTASIADGVTHVGFYSDGEIKPEFPVVLRRYPSIRFAHVTVEQLRHTGSGEDEAVAEAIEQSLRADDDLVGTTHQLLLLSPSGATETVTLDTAIENTKEVKNRPLAWTVGPKTVRMSSVATGPQTTTELDQLEEEHGT